VLGCSRSHPASCPLISMEFFQGQRQGKRLSNADSCSKPPFSFSYIQAYACPSRFPLPTHHDIVNFLCWMFRYFFPSVPFPFYYIPIIFIFAYLNYLFNLHFVPVPIIFRLYPSSVFYETVLICLLFPVLSSYVHFFVCSFPNYPSVWYFCSRLFSLKTLQKGLWGNCDMFVPAPDSLSRGENAPGYDNKSWKAYSKVE
jgi:hypothetical protein